MESVTARAFVPARLPAAPAPRRVGSMTLPQVALFDLDGTLIDTMPTLADLATDVLEEVFGMPRPLGREMYLATCGLPFIRQLDTICPGDARNQLASDLFEGRKPARCRQVRMPSDTRRALADLKKRGVRVVVSSNNGTENVEAFADDSGFPFDLVLAYDGKGMAKGRPHIDRAMAAFGVAREELIFVGDSLHDGDIAADQRVRFVGVAGTFSRERFLLRFPGSPVVSRIAELPDLFA